MFSKKFVMVSSVMSGNSSRTKEVKELVCGNNPSLMNVSSSSSLFERFRCVSLGPTVESRSTTADEVSDSVGEVISSDCRSLNVAMCGKNSSPILPISESLNSVSPLQLFDRLSIHAKSKRGDCVMRNPVS